MSRPSARRTCTAVLATGLAFGITLVAGTAPASAAVKPKGNVVVVLEPATGGSLYGGSLYGGSLYGGSLYGGSLDGGSLYGGSLYGGSVD